MYAFIKFDNCIRMFGNKLQQPFYTFKFKSPIFCYLKNKNTNNNCLSADNIQYMQLTYFLKLHTPILRHVTNTTFNLYGHIFKNNRFPCFELLNHISADSNHRSKIFYTLLVFLG